MLVSAAQDIAPRERVKQIRLQRIGPSLRLGRTPWPAAAFLLLVLTSCSPSDEPSASKSTFLDDTGRSIQVPHAPRRIVTLAPNLTELVFHAGGGRLLVGVSTADDFPEAVDSLARFSAYPLNMEAVAALQPDLVLATDQVNSTRHQEAFDALGIPVAYFRFDDLASIWSAVERIGELAGLAERADSAADSLRREATRLARSSASAMPPAVLLLIGDTDLYAFGGSSYTNELIRLAGGRSITEGIPTPSAVLSEEFVVNADPDVIVGAFGPEYDPARLLELHPTWRSLAAARSGRICSVEPDWLLRPGPRVLKGARAIRACLRGSNG